MNVATAPVFDGWQALSLGQRVLALKAGVTGCDRTLGLRRLARWQAQAPFDGTEWFSRKLAHLGLTPDQLVEILGESTESLSQRMDPPLDWAQAFQSAYDNLEAQYLKVPALSALPPREETSGFLYSVTPWLEQGVKQLQQGIESLQQRYPCLELAATFKSALVSQLTAQVLSMLTPTLTLELNVARLEGRLHGEDGRSRFLNFLEQLQDRRYALQLLSEYPVLVEQLVCHQQAWLRSSLELLERIGQDWLLLQTFCEPNQALGTLSDVKGGVGDTHQGGRSVHILTFSSGLNIVYKPRSLALDLHFQALLQWLNELCREERFQTVKILERGAYGWMQYVAPQPCSTLLEVKTFYRRMGYVLAVLYLLDATDIHSENLIASGAFPVIIDLETLFHPHTLEPATQYFLPAQHLEHSVMRVGLLPQRVWSKVNQAGVDLSGLGSTPGQILEGGLGLGQLGTDEMHLIRKEQALEPSHHRPQLTGMDLRVTAFSAEIESGFRDLYHVFMKHRQELTVYLNPFAQDQSRVVLRETRTYGLLLGESFHPDVLHNGLDRDRLFDKLWLDVPHRPYLEPLIQAEQTALWNGDIPIFQTQPGSRHLWQEDGTVMPDFFAQSSLEAVQQRLSQFSEADLEQQCWLIRHSLRSLELNEQTATPQPPSCVLVKAVAKTTPTQAPIPPSPWTAQQAALIDSAGAIADHLAMIALEDEHRIGWLSLNRVSRHHWSILPLDWTLFDGMPGIILFWAYFAHVTGQERFLALSRKALDSLLTLVNRETSSIQSIGGFKGWGGLIYLVTHLAHLWQSEELLALGLQWARQLPPLIDQDQDLDWIGGSAGCLCALLGLAETSDSPDLLPLIDRCGEQLVAKAQPMNQGVGWSTFADTPPLSGFSHGGAGIILALLRLYGRTGDDSLRNLALQGLSYERSLFSPTDQNWANLLAEPGEDPYAVAWSHGASGIGLARLAGLTYLDTPAIREEIQIAIATTLSLGISHNHSLCNGDFGHLDFLLQAQSFLNPVQQQTLDQGIVRILAAMQQQQWRCGLPLNTQTPGMMMGLAGIGYGLLRLHSPDRIPCVLTLSFVKV